MRRNYIILPLVVMCWLNSSAQSSYTISVFDNATLLPLKSFAAVWNQPLHLGATAGYEFHWNQNSAWFQNVKAGFYHHQFVQTGFQLYSEYGYRKVFNDAVFVDASFGLGYLHTIAPTKQAELNEHGEYEIDKNLGKPHLMFGPDFGVGYKIPQSPLSLYLGYQIWFEAPFIPGYVPLLPNGSVHLGLKYSKNPK